MKSYVNHKIGKCTHQMCIEWNKVKPESLEDSKFGRRDEIEGEVIHASGEEQKMKAVPWTCLMGLVY